MRDHVLTAEELNIGWLFPLYLRHQLNIGWLFPLYLRHQSLITDCLRFPAGDSIMGQLYSPLCRLGDPVMMQTGRNERVILAHNFSGLSGDPDYSYPNSKGTTVVTNFELIHPYISQLRNDW